MTNMSKVLANSKWDVLKNFMQGFPFHKAEIALANNFINFVDKEKKQNVPLQQIKDTILDYGEWKTQFADKDSNLNKLFDSEYFRPKRELKRDMIDIIKFTLVAIMCCNATVKEKIEALTNLIQKYP